VFERFTERARQVVVLAQDEARTLRHNYIGTEHLLLGLLREEEGLAAHVLGSLGVTLEAVRAQVARIVGTGDEATAGQVPFTPRAKKVLELSLREALSLSHNYIGTEHVLLGLARENEGVAARILLDFGVDAETIRETVIDTLGGPGGGESAPPGPFVPESPPLASEVAAEIERVRKEKEDALAGQEFERAAMLRDRERRLVHAARALTRAWHGEPEPPPTRPSRAAVGPRLRQGHHPPRRRQWVLPLLLGWLLAVTTGGVSLLVGRLIWG